MKAKIILIALVFMSCTKKAENIYHKPSQQGERFGVSSEDEPSGHRVFMVIWNGDKLVSEHYSDGCVIEYDTMPTIKLECNMPKEANLKLSWPE